MSFESITHFPPHFSSNFGGHPSFSVHPNFKLNNKNSNLIFLSYFSILSTFSPIQINHNRLRERLDKKLIEELINHRNRNLNWHYSNKPNDVGLFFFFFVVVENTKYFNTHTEKWEKVLKKLTITYTKMMLDFNITNSERKIIIKK